MNNYSGVIELEITSKCTLFCLECPRTKDPNEQNNKWKFGELSIRTFENLIKSIPKSTVLIFSGGYGDPIYHSKFIEIVDLCKQYEIKIVVNTNGSYRSESWWNMLASTIGPKGIFVFSVDGLEDTNHLYRINADWNSIMLGMNIMAKKAACTIEWKFIVFKHNQHQIEKAYRLSRKIGVESFQIIKSNRLPKGMEPTIDFNILLDNLKKLSNEYDNRS